MTTAKAVTVIAKAVTVKEDSNFLTLKARTVLVKPVSVKPVKATEEGSHLKAMLLMKSLDTSLLSQSSLPTAPTVMVT